MFCLDVLSNFMSTATVRILHLQVKTKIKQPLQRVASMVSFFVFLICYGVL